MSENGNGELTRQVLRAELRAGLAEQELKFNERLDEKLEPVYAHIKRVDSGVMTEAQKAAVVETVNEAGERKFRRFSAPLAVFFSALSLVVSSLYTFTHVKL